MKQIVEPPFWIPRFGLLSNHLWEFQVIPCDCCCLEQGLSKTLAPRLFVGEFLGMKITKYIGYTTRQGVGCITGLFDKP